MKQWFLSETISDFQFECCGVRSKSDYGLHGVKVPESCGTSVREKIARKVRNFRSFYILFLATSFFLLQPYFFLQPFPCYTLICRCKEAEKNFNNNNKRLFQKNGSQPPE